MKIYTQVLIENDFTKEREWKWTGEPKVDEDGYFELLVVEDFKNAYPASSHERSEIRDILSSINFEDVKGWENVLGLKFYFIDGICHLYEVDEFLLNPHLLKLGFNLYSSILFS
jgi:hypothetical protein